MEHDLPLTYIHTCHVLFVHMHEKGTGTRVQVKMLNDLLSYYMYEL